MKKLLILLIALVMTVFPLAACGNGDDNVIRINEVTHSIFYAPLYAAQNLGYFEEENLKIELTNGGGSDKSMTAVLSGDADIGLMGPETAIYVEQTKSTQKNRGFPLCSVAYKYKSVFSLVCLQILQSAKQ